MNDNQQSVDNIHIGIKSLIDMLSQEVDLKDDVLPFLKPTLSKISQISQQNIDFQNLYEILQITTNYLPKTIQTYCGLPIEYRNTKLIKYSQTARDLLISDIELLKAQVTAIENKVFAEIETHIKVNNKVIKEKFTPQLQLATQVENNEGQKFINQFDIKKYINNPNTYEIFNKKLEHKKTYSESKENLEKTINIVSNQSKTILKKICDFTGTLWPRFKTLLLKLSILLLTASFPVFMITMAYISGREDRFRKDIYTQMDSMYNILKIHKLSATQLEELKNNNENILIDGSNYRKEHVNYEFKNNIISINLKEISKHDCQKMISYQKNNYSKSNMQINNINITSDKNSVLENEQLCYLEDNHLKIDFDYQKIYESK